MIKHDKLKIILTGLILITLAGAAHASTATVEGRVQGLNCVLHQKICAIDHNDPRAAAVSVFVIYSGDKNYKIVDKLSRATLASYLGKQVRVKGRINKKYNAIEADSLAVKKDGQFKTVWTSSMDIKNRNDRIIGIGGGQ